jgi:hypothetical protein
MPALAGSGGSSSRQKRRSETLPSAHWLRSWVVGVEFSFSVDTTYADVSADLGSSSPPSGCEGTCGLPINLRTGNTYIGQQDYSLPGLSGGLGLTRTWNSMWPLSSPVNEVVVRQNRVGPRNQQLPQFPQPIRLL